MEVCIQLIAKRYIKVVWLLKIKYCHRRFLLSMMFGIRRLLFSPNKICMVYWHSWNADFEVSGPTFTCIKQNQFLHQKSQETNGNATRFSFLYAPIGLQQNELIKIILSYQVPRYETWRKESDNSYPTQWMRQNYRENKKNNIDNHCCGSLIKKLR